jgi:PKD repeat protein
MTFFGGLFKGLSAMVVSVLALGLFSVAAAPTASFTMAPPGNPVMGQVVQLTDTSTGSPTSWSWNFGDGQISTQQNPTHVYGGPGPFNVTLMAANADGASPPKLQTVFVSPIDTLRLDPTDSGGHPFKVTLTARDTQRTGNTGVGQALPQNQKFGYFSLPALTGDPSNPEVFVKVLDGTVVNGQYWVFYGHLTDLEYTLSVTEVATGRTKSYHKDPGPSPGGFDTSGFNFTPTPTNSPTPTPTPTPPASSTRIVNVGQNGMSFTDTVSGGSGTTIHVGDKVEWDFVATSSYHSTTSGYCISGGGYYGDDTCYPDGLWDSSEVKAPVKYSHTFTTAGTFKYYCSVDRSMMSGTVVVQP